VGPRAGLVAVAKRKESLPLRGIELHLSGPYPEPDVSSPHLPTPFP